MIDTAVLEKIKPGATVKIWERVPVESKPSGKKEKKGKEADKERISQFSGLVLARKHGSEPGASFTVRTTLAGIGVEKVFPIHSPLITKVEIINSPRKVHRAKLYYVRDRSKKEIRQRITSAAVNTPASDSVPEKPAGVATESEK